MLDRDKAPFARSIYRRSVEKWCKRILMIIPWINNSLTEKQALNAWINDAEENPQSVGYIL